MEKLPDDQRAVEHFKHLSSIQLLHEAQIAPEQLETLTFIGEASSVTEVQTSKKSNQKNSKKSELKSTEKFSDAPGNEAVFGETEELPSLLFDDELDDESDSNWQIAHKNQNR
ncbi:hypothetical protein D3C75_898030 [compost metagenome]